MLPRYLLPRGIGSRAALSVAPRAQEAIAVDSGAALDEATQHYQTLISLMLSSQTKDTVNAATMVSAAPTLNPGPRTLSPSPGPEP